MYKKKIVVFMLAITTILFLFMVTNVSVNASGIGSNSTGSSSITINPSHVTLLGGSGTSIAYTVKLSSGSTWGTTINTVSVPNGLTVTGLSYTGDPPYSGTFTVTASQTITPGNYTIQLSATGDDPSTSNAILYITITGTTSKNGVGTSNVTLNPSHVSLPKNSETSINYTVKLSSGSTWGTTINTVSVPNGLTVTGLPYTGDPPYSGTFTVTVSKTITPGNYTIQLSATGDDPSTTNAILYITITNKTSTIPLPTTSPPATANIYFPTGSLAVYGYIGILIILISIIIGFVLAKIDALNSYNKKIIKYLFIFEIISGIFLLTDDNILYSTAIFHWAVLLMYVLVFIIIDYLLFTKKELTKVYILSFLASGLLFLFLLGDLFLNLPYTSFQSNTNISWPYFFGFGTTAISTFGISLAFTIILILNNFVMTGTLYYLFKNIDQIKKLW
ncbi:MAG: hypothetical protein M1481_06485 [Candidatus Thermoplasmatota archaeon]|nr:hypothetical protein [Candidatus Thermoplasmatota archaeon]MCL5963736.1 hypothetical protein [Candidatus Thermoplasmatota archaeon]